MSDVWQNYRISSLIASLTRPAESIKVNRRVQRIGTIWSTNCRRRSQGTSFISRVTRRIVQSRSRITGSIPTSRMSNTSNIRNHLLGIPRTTNSRVGTILVVIPVGVAGGLSHCVGRFKLSGDARSKGRTNGRVKAFALTGSTSTSRKVKRRTTVQNMGWNDRLRF